MLRTVYRAIRWAGREDSVGLFRRAPTTHSEEQAPFTDEQWLASGHQRFDVEKSKYFGSPETMRAGGEQMLATGDEAAAVFFFGKAIDIAQTWINSRPSQRSYEDDLELFGKYVETVQAIRSAHPMADLVSDRYNENATRSAYYMIQLANTAHEVGRPTDPLYARIETLIEVTGMAPPETWSR
jgi:hypothetical protein